LSYISLCFFIYFEHFVS